MIEVAAGPTLPRHVDGGDAEAAGLGLKDLLRIGVARAAAALAVDHVGVPCSPGDLRAAADQMSPVGLVSEDPERTFEAGVHIRLETRGGSIQRLAQHAERAEAEFAPSVEAFGLGRRNRC